MEQRLIERMNDVHTRVELREHDEINGETERKGKGSVCERKRKKTGEKTANDA